MSRPLVLVRVLQVIYCVLSPVTAIGGTAEDGNRDVHVLSNAAELFDSVAKALDVIRVLPDVGHIDQRDINFAGSK